MKFDFVIGNPPYQEQSVGDNDTFTPPVYNKFMDADTFNEIYGFVADILNQTITSVTFDDYGYEVDGSSEYSDYDGNYEDGMHDFLINIIYGYLK